MKVSGVCLSFHSALADCVSQTPDIVCQCPGEITSPPECFNGNYFPLLWEKKSVWDDIDFQECREGQCSDPCLGFSECGTGAVCVSVNHLPTCKCPDGYKVRIFRYYLSPRVIDYYYRLQELNSPYDACVPASADLTQLECLEDSDCGRGTCHVGKCRTPWDTCRDTCTQW